MCSWLGMECGVATDVDNCGHAVSDACGECSSGATCVQGHCRCPEGSEWDASAKACVQVPPDAGTQCVPPAAAVVCEVTSSECGPVVAVDSCGQAVTIDCGVCGDRAFCASGACHCETGFASEDPKAGCSPGGAGGGGGGPGGGGPGGGGGACVAPSPAAVCSWLGLECGLASDVDSCGNPVTVTCGECLPEQTCAQGHCQ